MTDRVDHSDQTAEGLRLLVVEDEVLVAMGLADALTDAGCRVVGPAMHLDDAVSLASKEAIDGAVLDVNVDGEMIFPVADILESRGIPFVFTTGYGAAGLGPYAGRPVLQKPFTVESLIKATETWGRH